MRRAALVVAVGLAGCPGPSAPCDQWDEAVGRLDRVVLAAWEAPGGVVYVAGGGLGVAGAGALAARVGDDGLESLGIERPETFWWVWGTSADDVWFVGENGAVVRDGAAVASGTDATLFGVWGASGQDVWVVGGTPGTKPGEDDVVLRWDGLALARDAAVPAAGAALFKVWGASSEDVWIVGERGRLLHRTGGAWVDETDAALSQDNLLTVHGCGADDVWAVGGKSLLHYDGTAWTRLEDPVLPAAANGVACGADTVLVVGNGGLKLRLDRATGTWTNDQFEAPFDTDFHGALVATDGAAWAVGGTFNAPAAAGPRVGVLATRRVCGR